MNYQQLLNEFNPKLKQIVNEVSGNLDLDPFLLEMINYQMEQGGKRFRPLLFLESAKVFDCDLDFMTRLAVCIEIIHNASLVHDDIQDYDSHRRGKIAAWKFYSRPQAINLGDVLMVIALEFIFNSTENELDQLQLTKMLAKAIRELINGQVNDIKRKNCCFLYRDEYDQIVSGKTGALFRLIFNFLGAYIPDRMRDCPTITEQLEEVGTHLGNIFQIRDDIIDFTGDKEGRKIYQDIEKGRVSILKALAYEQASDEIKAKLESISECHKRLPQNVKLMVEIYEELEVLSKAKQILQREKDQLFALQVFELKPEFKTVMTDFVDLLKV